MSFWLPTCDGTSMFLVDPMEFAFASIGTGTDLLVAFGFAFVFAPMET